MQRRPILRYRPPRYAIALGVGLLLTPACIPGDVPSYDTDWSRDFGPDEPDIEASPWRPRFGTVDWKAEPVAWMTVEIRNQGGSDLELTHLTRETEDPNLTVYGLQPEVLDSDESVQLLLRYTPEPGTDMEDTIVIRSNDPDEPTLEVEVSGRGS